MIHKNISEEENNSRLDQAATILFKDYSRSQIQKWISQGNLAVNGEILKVLVTGAFNSLLREISSL